MKIEYAPDPMRSSLCRVHVRHAHQEPCTPGTWTPGTWTPGRGRGSRPGYDASRDAGRLARPPSEGSRAKSRHRRQPDRSQPRGVTALPAGAAPRPPGGSGVAPRVSDPPPMREHGPAAPKASDESTRAPARCAPENAGGFAHVLSPQPLPADGLPARPPRTDGVVGMTALAPQPIISRPSPAAVTVKGSRLLSLLRTTDHKTIGLMYLVTSFVFFIAGGLMAMLIRAELAQPGLQFLSAQQYNQLFTMHGTVMLLMFATPLFFAFGNLVMPLQIGAPDVAFPRLNAFSYWLFLFG